MNHSEDPRIKYGILKEKYLLISAKHRKILLYLSVLRLLVFFGGILLSISGFSYSLLFGFGSMTVSGMLFFYLLKLYSDHTDKHQFYKNLVKINDDEIKALNNDYSAFRDGAEWISSEHSFTYDVDIFGKDSLFQYLNRTVTGFGRRILAGWLSDPYECSKDLVLRQEAIKELSQKPEWRQEFAAYGMGQSIEEDDIKSLLQWLSENPVTRLSLFLNYAIFVLPVTVLITLGLTLTGHLHYSVFTLIFLINLLLVVSKLKETNRLHNLVSRKHNYLVSFSRLLDSFKNQDFRSSVLSGIRNDLTGYPGSAIESIVALGRITRSFDSRLNMLVGFALNGLLLWDLHCVRSLEKWKRRSLNLMPKLLEDLGTIDAYNSLANYAFNNHGFAWPGLSDSSVVLSCTQLGHPLLPAERRVSNDFIIGRQGNIVIITGANMAGKSTFLRTVAVNMVLAMTGSPVCAESMTFRSVKLFTSMRTTDSLSHNESYFYAELKRLKILKKEIQEDKNVFFILDEILKGTNSADKSSGSRLFLKKCIELGGTGLIATHDTTLAGAANEFPEQILNKCFEIEIDGEKVSFDYILRDGITTRMNASILMREMGITD